MKTHSKSPYFIVTLVLGWTLCNLAFCPIAYGRDAPGQHTIVRANVALDPIQLEGYLNINQATESQWNLLPGIGPTIARRLIEYRSKRPFGTISQVRRVKGIGKKKYQKIKRYLSLHGDTTLRVVPSPGVLP